MCLYPRQMVNKKYTVTEKNGGCVPSMPIIGTDQDGFEIYDERVATIEVPCGNCIECRKQKAREWQVRMNEEIKVHDYNYFVTLTFSNQSLLNIMRKLNCNENNDVATYAVRKLHELWRKHNKCQLKHWYITELGHENTERIHLHGIIFSDKPLEFEPIKDLDHMYTWKYWKYGHVYVGDYVNSKTINYVMKYVTKIDTDHKGFVGKILCSPGIGKNFVEHEQRKGTYKYRPRQSKDFYVLNNGCKTKLPTYFKNKFYNEEERELIWREAMDKNETVILGNIYKNSITKSRSIGNVLETAKYENRFLGYGDDSIEWQKKKTYITKKMLSRAEARKEAHFDIMRKLENIRKKNEEKFAYVKNNM